MPITPLQSSEHLKMAIAKIANKIVQAGPDTQVSSHTYNHGIATASATLTAFPELNISNTNKVEVRTFFDGADSGPTTEDFLKRMNSLVDAAKSLPPPHLVSAREKEEFAKEMEKLREEFIKEIQSYQLDNALYGDSLEPRNDTTAQWIRSSLKENHAKLKESRETRQQRLTELQGLAKTREYKEAEKKLNAAEKKFHDFIDREGKQAEKSDAYRAAEREFNDAQKAFKEEHNKHSQTPEYQNARIAYNQADKDYHQQRVNYIKKVNATFHEYAANIIFPRLIEKVRNDKGEDPGVTARRLRDAEIKNITEKGRPILFNQYQVSKLTDRAPTSQHFDMQIPIGYFTDEQRQALNLPPNTSTLTPNTNSCYKRNDEGVSGLVVQATGYIDDEGRCVVDSAFVRHTSPLPVEILNDDGIRAAKTVRNAHQVAQNLALAQLQAEAAATGRSLRDIASAYRENPLSVNVSEIRLLSVHSRLFDNLPGFKDQHQYLQILETFYAFHAASTQVSTLTIPQPDEAAPLAVKIKLNPIVMSFGVNAVRGKLIRDDLHAWINTRGFNQLADEFEHYLTNLPTHNLSPNAKLLHEELRSLLNPELEEVKSLKEKEIAEKIKLYKAELMISHTDLELAFKMLRELINQYEQFIKTNPHDAQGISSHKAKIEQINAAIMKKLENNHQLEEKLISARDELLNDANKKRRIERLLTEVTKEARALRDTPSADRPPLTAAQLASAKAAENLLCLADGYLEVQNLRQDDKYSNAENNYLIQAHLGRLFEHLGYAPASGCNDDKDRGGRYAITRTAIEKFINQFGRVPLHTNKSDMVDLEKIMRQLAESSVNLYHAELTSAPGARGFQLYKGDGNGMFNLENSDMAKLGKEIYPPLGARPTQQTALSSSPPTQSAKELPDPDELQMEEMPDRVEVDNENYVFYIHPSSAKSHEMSPENPRIDPTDVTNALNDFIKINLNGVFMRNEKLTEALLLHHWHEINWFKSDENNKAIKKSCLNEQGVPDPIKITNAIKMLRTRYDSVYQEGISQLVDKYADDHKLINSVIMESPYHSRAGQRISAFSLGGTQQPLGKHASEKDIETLRRVISIQKIKGDVKTAVEAKNSGKPSLLDSSNWQSRSFVFGVHFALKFWGTERSLEIQKMDVLIAQYDKATTPAEKGPILLELANVIKEWNKSHQILHKTSRRASAVEELHTEVMRTLNELNNPQSASRPSSPPSPK